MTLLEPARANAFLAQYKRLLCTIAAKPLKIINDYSEARKALYKDGFNKSFVFDSSYEESFVNAVRKRDIRHVHLRKEIQEWLCA